MSGHSLVWARALTVGCDYCGRPRGLRCITTAAGHASSHPGRTTREPHLDRLLASAPPPDPEARARARELNDGIRKAKARR